MNDLHLTPEAVVAEILDRYPGTASVFLRCRMACVGCELSPFETVADAAGNYGLSLADLLAELRGAADQPQ